MARILELAVPLRNATKQLDLELTGLVLLLTLVVIGSSLLQ